MTFTRSHTSSPAGATSHLWTVRNDAGAITLAAIRTADSAPAWLTNSGYAFNLPSGGSWMFSVIQTHTPIAKPTGWLCPHHDDCEMDAIVSSIARPAWERIAAAGVSDEAVCAELEQIHGNVFQAVAR